MLLLLLKLHIIFTYNIEIFKNERKKKRSKNINIDKFKKK